MTARGSAQPGARGTRGSERNSSPGERHGRSSTSSSAAYGAWTSAAASIQATSASRSAFHAVGSTPSKARARRRSSARAASSRRLSPRPARLTRSLGVTERSSSREISSSALTTHSGMRADFNARAMRWWLSPPSLLAGTEFTHHIREPPELDHPLHRHAECQSPNRDRFVGSALCGQFALDHNQVVSASAAHLGEPSALDAPRHGPQQPCLFLRSPMDYRVLTEAVKAVPEVAVHDGAPRPPDVVGHAFRHGGHEPAGLGHRKGQRETSSQREIAPDRLHADTLSAVADTPGLSGPPSARSARRAYPSSSSSLPGRKLGKLNRGPHSPSCPGEIEHSHQRHAQSQISNTLHSASDGGADVASAWRTWTCSAGCGGRTVTLGRAHDGREVRAPGPARRVVVTSPRPCSRIAGQLTCGVG